MGACLYFAKDIARLRRQHLQEQKWEPYQVSILRGSTLGVVGYGTVPSFHIDCIVAPLTL
jgi:phosphoglycerate dehydrogenase-like enzyme